MHNFIAMMTRSNVFLLLGSNIGDKKAEIEKAIQFIQKKIGKVKAISSLYESEPWQGPGQDNYMNRAIQIETTLTPDDLLKQIKSAEKILGRKSNEKWAAREIDIDILFFGRKVIKQKELQIPHPHMHERNFAIIPMMEIAPDFKHPTLDLTMDELYEQTLDASEVILHEEKV